jgi:hypothetical protein
MTTDFKHEPNSLNSASALRRAKRMIVLMLEKLF